VAEINDFLKYVDISELHEKICIFRNLDFKKLSYSEVQNEIQKVITFETANGDRSFLTPSTTTYPKGTSFYRVRTLSDTMYPLKEMRYVTDCWEPPAEIVNAGRLNKLNEPLLYTSPIDPVVAVEELGIPDNNLFSLIVYEAIEPINVVQIGLEYFTEGLSADERLKHRMIQDFLSHEFIRDVGEGTEYLYKISESIAKDYFDLPPWKQDAWCYPSVARKGSCNVCFRPTTRTKLKLVGVQMTSVIRQYEYYKFSVKMVATDSGNGSDLIFQQMSDEEQAKLFPDFEVLPA